MKGFNTWFRKQFPGAYVGVKRHYDHLYIDMASYLHEELRRGEMHPVLMYSSGPAVLEACVEYHVAYGEVMLHEASLTVLTGYFAQPMM